MRKTFRFRRHQKQAPPRFRVNQFITAPEVRVIGDQGENLGVLSTLQALAQAREQGMDLVEVSPKAEPPVARIIDYGSFKYQQEKQERKQKAKVKKVELKGIRISLNIGEHDRAVRVEQAREFLNEGNKVKIEMVLRGRERQRGDLARIIINEFIEALGEHIIVEQPTAHQGGRLTTIVGKKF